MMHSGIADGFRDAGRYEPSHLIAGEFPRVSRYVTLVAGPALPDGAVLGQIAADRRYQLSDALVTDGSQVPDAILAEPVEERTVDMTVRVYFTGEFHFSALTLGPNHSLATLQDAFRPRSIFLRE